MTSDKNDVEKDGVLDIQMKSVYILTLEKDIQVLNQKSNLGNLLNWTYKRNLLVLKNFLRWGKGMIKRNQVQGPYFKVLKAKFVKIQWRNTELVYLSKVQINI